MGYCTLEDLTDRFGEGEILQLSDKANGSDSHTGTINETRVQLAIDDATSEINAHLAACFDVAAINVLYDADKYVPRLKSMCADIARYRLFDTISEDHEAYRRYKQVKKDLEGICKIVLLDSDGVVVPSGTIGGFSVYGECKPSLIPPARCGAPHQDPVGGCCDD